MRVIILVIFIATCSSCSVRQSPEKDRPNIILILTDDQGSVDINSYGASDLTTPNLDRLLSEGVHFSQFYTGSSVCSPSRACILTGMTPQSAGVPGNVSSIPGNAGMPSSKTTIAEMLKDNGYATAHIGKWHLGYTPGTMPPAQGFDYSFGHMGGCIDNYSHFFYWNGPNRHDLWKNGKEVYHGGEFFPTLMYREAEKFILRNKNKPFFLYYAMNAPHYPLQPEKKWRRHYKNMEMPRRDYAAFISTADENIGKLIKLLGDINARDNTIIIFLSDHGHSYETRTFGGGGSAGPFRGGKTSLFEGGIRVPAIISWPGNIPGGEVRNQACHSIDLLPTIASFCNIDRLPEDIEGRDISAMLTDNEDIEKISLYWKLGSQWAVLKNNWKLIGLPHDPSGESALDKVKDRLFLVNLAKDSTESRNLAEEYPDTLDLMLNEYLKWEHASEEDIPVETEFSNQAAGAEIRLSNPPGKKYNDGGARTLIDNTGGSRSFNDGCWLGFEQKDLEAEIDLEETRKVSSVRIRFLNSPENWIFGPRYVEVRYSGDGTAYSDPIRINGPFGPKKILNIQSTEIDINKNIRYLKVSAGNIKGNPAWHSNPGGNTWLFCDEIIIK